MLEQMRLRQIENARIAKEARDREKVYNETLYNMLRPDYKDDKGKGHGCLLRLVAPRGLSAWT